MNKGKKLYILKTELEGFKANSAEMEMLAEVVNKGSADTRVYLDKEAEGAHNLVERYCKNKKVKFRIIDLEELVDCVIEQESSETHALITSRTYEQLEEYLIGLRHSEVNIETRERRY